jgi:predicted acylesterase/phospholipase RssA
MSPKEITKNKKVALVLSGGAARGLAHLGVLKGLEELGIKPSIIVGTSMGALIGAGYATHPHSGWVYREMKGYNPMAMLRLIDLTAPGCGIIKGKRIENTIRDRLGDVKFSDLEIPLIVNATNIVDGSDFVFREGSVVDAVRASISIPFIFTPVRKDGILMVDGGLTNNLFFSVLVPMADQYDLFLLVNLNSSIYKIKDSCSFIEMVMQVLFIMEKNQVEKNLKILELSTSRNDKDFRNKMLIISPDVGDMSVTHFDKIDELSKRGYDCLMENKDKIQKMLK